MIEGLFGASECLVQARLSGLTSSEGRTCTRQPGPPRTRWILFWIHAAELRWTWPADGRSTSTLRSLPRGPSVLSERAAAAWTPKESLPISTSWGPAWAACCGRDPRPWLFTAGKPVIDTTFTILFQYNTNFTVLGPDWHLKRPWYTKHPPNDRANAPSTSAAEQIQGLTFLKKNDHGKHLQDTAHLFTVFPLLLGTRCCIIFTNNYRLYVYTLLPLVQNRISASNRLLAIIKEVWV